ncbi:Asp-tRNA(Asn)/Glu-tRNA(Gln) amidotransferase subunit GatB [Candidatus Dependentiae bacterium]
MTQKIKSILEKYPEYNATIGIEIHVQLKTKSKIFCPCPNNFGDAPNTNICPICTGYPGTLPSLNKKVVDFAIILGIATNSQIKQISKFARKHYMYPDLPKNYQITQGSAPICKEGFITIDLPTEKEKNIRLTRIHIEEDAGKNIHNSKINKSLVDLNRAGTPLLEIVSYPDISSSYEAKSYLTNLKLIIQYLNISSADMEKGSFRADINISVKKKNNEQLGTRVELKNMNSFKFITQAIDYEIERQIELLKINKEVKQESRQWNTKTQKTVFMRSKSDSQDYRYLREPDLPLIIIDEQWRNNLKKTLPELPREKFKRFKQKYNLSSYESEILISNIDIAIFFEKVIKICNEPKHTCNWILRNVLAFLNENKISIQQSKINSQNFAELIKEISSGTINSKIAQEVFTELATTGKSPRKIIDEKDLKQINSIDELKKIIIQIIQKNPDQLQKYLNGKENLFKFFVGQVMKETKGKANPKIIQDLLKKYLK